ncbi:hypothetical protein [Faecalispora anaeroviscerum]|uniref:hypothetical protein n=1 Tax=Faecalispora anaeroviscerum TaxID=2991836 RepID=UPI0024BA9BA1|nr:hypothetical protein [Faecalispora anaeroviscerum]
MNEKLQKWWYLLAYLFIVYVLLSALYRILRATDVFDLAVLRSFLFWPPLALLCAIFFFSLWLYQKSGEDRSKYMQDKKFVRLFFFIGFGLAVVLSIITDYLV